MSDVWLLPNAIQKPTSPAKRYGNWNFKRSGSTLYAYSDLFLAEWVKYQQVWPLLLCSIFEYLLLLWLLFCSVTSFTHFLHFRVSFQCCASFEAELIVVLARAQCVSSHFQSTVSQLRWASASNETSLEESTKTNENNSGSWRWTHTLTHIHKEIHSHQCSVAHQSGSSFIRIWVGNRYLPQLSE